MSRALHITIMPIFKKGDPPPSGYLEWHEWADVQHKAGLRQRKCEACSKWRFPQEMKDGCCVGCKKPDRSAGFTVDDVIEGRVVRTAKGWKRVRWTATTANIQPNS